MMVSRMLSDAGRLAFFFPTWSFWYDTGDNFALMDWSPWLSGVWVN